MAKTPRPPSSSRPVQPKAPSTPPLAQDAEQSSAEKKSEESSGQENKPTPSLLGSILREKLSERALDAMEREGLFAPEMEGLFPESGEHFDALEGEEEEEEEEMPQVWGALDFYDEEDTRALIRSLEQQRDPRERIGSIFLPLEARDLTYAQGKSLSVLPRTEETWVVGALPTTQSLVQAEEGASVMSLWMHDEEEALLGHFPFDPDEGTDPILDSFLRVALQPAKGEPRLPAQINVSQRRWVGAFRNLLQGFSIPVFYGGRRHLERVASHHLWSKPVHEPPQSPALGMLDADAEHLERYFATAAALYDTDFWKKSYEDQVFVVDLGSWGYGRYTVSVMGAQREEIGLRLFSSLQDYRVYSLFGVDVDLQVRLGEHGIQHLMLRYESKDDIPETIQKRQHQGRWKLASYDAFPVLSVVQPDDQKAAPSAHFYEPCIAIFHALTQFFDEHDELFLEQGAPPIRAFWYDLPMLPERPPIQILFPHPDLPSDEEDEGDQSGITFLER